MDKFKFLKDAIADSDLEEFIVRTVTDYLLLQAYRFDSMEQLAYKIQRQWNYIFEFKYEDFRKKNIIDKYTISNNVDVYAKLNDNKNITIVFNQKLTTNLQRFLFLKVCAYDIFDEWHPGDELRLSVLNCKTNFERNWAERFAIDLTMSYNVYSQMKEGLKGGHIIANQKIMEPELYIIREHDFKEERGRDRLWMIPESNKLEH